MAALRSAGRQPVQYSRHPVCHTSQGRQAAQQTAHQHTHGSCRIDNVGWICARRALEGRVLCARGAALALIRQAGASGWYTLQGQKKAKQRHIGVQHTQRSSPHSYVHGSQVGRRCCACCPPPAAPATAFLLTAWHVSRSRSHPQCSLPPGKWRSSTHCRRRTWRSLGRRPQCSRWC